MIRYENNCCGCNAAAYPCNPSQCSMMRQPVLICDCCHEEVDNLYWVDGDQYCEKCALSVFEEVDVGQ